MEKTLSFENRGLLRGLAASLRDVDASLEQIITWHNREFKEWDSYIYSLIAELYNTLGRVKPYIEGAARRM